MLERSFDIARINEVVNHPAVRPFVGPGDEFADATVLVENDKNWFLMGEHGGFCLEWKTPDMHEVHTFILPEGRGEWARDAAKAGIAFAVENGDKYLCTLIPPGQRNVAAYARSMGMRPTGEETEMLGTRYQNFKMEIG